MRMIDADALLDAFAAENDAKECQWTLYGIKRKIEDAPTQEPCEDAELDFVQPHKKIPVNLETCGDSISRHDALERLIYVLSETEWFNAKAILDELPSVRPEEEPQLVIYSGDGYADGELVYDWAECPKCGYEYEEDDKDWREPFCPHCGQPLIWEVNECQKE